jgi:hypothetical protein
MTFRLLPLGALIVGAVAAGPVTAQEVITNPGWCAQFYPNANCTEDPIAISPVVAGGRACNGTSTSPTSPP